VQARLFKSLKLWSFYVDLEEALGSVENAKEVYDKILELKIANAQVIVNYAAFLEENKYYEESFKVRRSSPDLRQALMPFRCMSAASNSSRSLCRLKFGTYISLSSSSDMCVFCSRFAL
jgi:Tfp pilus assembly protein PilF